MLVQLQGKLVGDRLIVKPRGLGEGLVDQRLRHVMAGNHEEPDLGQRVVNLLGGALQGAGGTGDIVRQIDHRNGCVHE